MSITILAIGLGLAGTLVVARTLFALRRAILDEVTELERQRADRAG